MTVLEFKRPDKPKPPQEPLMTIYIYPGDDNGFHYIVTGHGEPPTREVMQQYLGDMFLSLTERPPSPGIFQWLQTFWSRLFPINGDHQ